LANCFAIADHKPSATQNVPIDFALFMRRRSTWNKCSYAALCFCGKTAVGKGLSLLTGSRHESGDRIERNWKQRGKVQHHWGKLTDDDLDRVGGCRNELAVRIQ
jgi:hypothetical protein